MRFVQLPGGMRLNLDNVVAITPSPYPGDRIGFVETVGGKTITLQADDFQYLYRCTTGLVREDEHFR